MCKPLYFLGSFLVASLIFISCGDDEDPSTSNDCMSTDFLGIWDGPIECDSSNVNLLSIEFFDDQGVLTTKYVGNEFEAMATGCTLTSLGDFGNYGFDISATLDGGEMSMTIEEWSPFGTDNCTATIKKR